MAKKKTPTSAATLQTFERALRNALATPPRASRSGLKTKKRKPGRSKRG
jgi:hypothetical protein